MDLIDAPPISLRFYGIILMIKIAYHSCFLSQPS